MGFVQTLLHGSGCRINLAIARHGPMRSPESMVATSMGRCSASNTDVLGVDFLRYAAPAGAILPHALALPQRSPSLARIRKRLKRAFHPRQESPHFSPYRSLRATGIAPESLSPHTYCSTRERFFPAQTCDCDTDSLNMVGARKTIAGHHVT